MQLGAILRDGFRNEMRCYVSARRKEISSTIWTQKMNSYVVGKQPLNLEAF